MSSDDCHDDLINIFVVFETNENIQKRNVLYERVCNTILVIYNIWANRRNTEPYFEVHLLSEFSDLLDILGFSNCELVAVKQNCIGLEATLDQAIRMTKPGGKIMVMGVFGKKPAMDMNTLQEAERAIYTSQAHIDEIAEALGRLRSGEIPGERLITREVTLETLVSDGFEELIAHGPEHIKVLIRIGGQV